MPHRPPYADHRVIKKLPAGSQGAKALTTEYGDRLVCVRHRLDPAGTKRITTVELVVSTKPIARRPSPIVAVRLRVHERALQRRLKAAGARWDDARQVWRVRRATAMALGLRQRIEP